MRLYSFQPSPYGTRVRLALRRKGVAFDVAPPPEVDPSSLDALAPSPMEVPTLVGEDGTAVSGSAAILEYIEETHPEPSLLPRAPAARARARMLAQTPDGYMQNAPRRLFGMADPAQRDPAAVEEAFGMIATALAFVDARLDGDGGWAVADRPSLADCSLVPMLNAVSLIGSIHARPDVIARHARLGAYWATARAEAVNAAAIAEQLAGLPPPLQAFATAGEGGRA